jgi:hypothetical protein
VLYLDAKTGREITRVQVAASSKAMPEAATPELAVRSYLTLTSEGRYEAAWPLLHPVSQKPVPPVPVGLVLLNFYAHEGRTGPALKAVLDVKLPAEGIGTKQAFCMCFLNPARVRVELEDGSEQTIQVVQDSNGNWRVLWELR